MAARDTSTTFAKGLRLLECIAEGGGDPTMAELARRTGLDRAATRRLCLTLEAGGYLRRDGKALRLAPRVLALAGGYLAREGIGRSIQPVLNHYAQELRSEIALALRDGTRAIYVARSSVGEARLSHGFSVGSTLPLLPTAVGRMLLAGLAPGPRAALIAQCPLWAHTPATLRDRAEIAARVEAAAAQGFAHAAEEFETGAAGLAVPARELSGTRTVLATTDAVNRLSSPAQIDRALDVLRQAAIALRG